MHYVLGFQFNQNRTRLALILKTHPTDQAGRWNGIGGKVEISETPEQAMKREFGEEAGVNQQDVDWKKFASYITRKGDEVSCFISMTDSVEKVWSATDEKISLFNLSELGSGMRFVPNVPWLIRMALSTVPGEYSWSQPPSSYTVFEQE